MKRVIFVVIIGMLVITTTGMGCQAQSNTLPGLKLLKDIPMPGGANRFDYQSIDPSNRRLYISHMNSNAVVVFDMDKQAVIANIEHIARPTGILAVPELGKVYVSASHANEIVVIDEHTLSVVHRISSGGFPDGIAFEPGTKRIFVSDEHGKQVTVIDAKTDKPITNIETGGEVGNTHYNSATHKIYSAIQTKNQLICIDPVDNKILNRFELQECKGPHGFYIDPVTNYALVTGERDGQFVALDLSSGKVIYKDKVGDDPDVLAFDSVYHKLYVSSESGTISVFSIEANKIKKLAEGFVARHAHTISVDPQKHIVYIPLEDVNGKPVLRLFETR